MALTRTDELQPLLSKAETAPPALKYQPHSKIIFYSTKAMLPFTAIHMILAARYGAGYSAEGTERLLNMLHLSAPAFALSVGVVSFVSTNFTNFTSASWEAVPRDLDARIHGLLHPPESAPRAWFASPLTTTYNGLSHILYATAFLAGTYMGLEPVKEILQASLGTAGALIPLTLLGIGGIISYAHPYGPRCIENMQYYLESIRAWGRNDPAIAKRLRNHGSLTIEIEAHLEALTNPACRAFLSSFSFLRLAEQWGLPSMILMPLGGMSGAALSLLVFTPDVIKAYHGHFDTSLEDGGPVSQEERSAMYQKRYRNMPCHERALAEAKRLFFFGLAQGSLALYYSITWLSPTLHQKLTEYGMKEQHANLISCYLMIGGTVVICVYASSKAHLYKELNKAALADRKIRCTVIVEEMPHQSPKQTTEKDQSQGYGTQVALVGPHEKKEIDRKVSRNARIAGSAALFLANATQLPSLFVSTAKHMPELDAAIFSGTVGTVNATSRYLSWENETIEQTDVLFQRVSALSMFSERSRPIPDDQPRRNFCDKLSSYFNFRRS